MSGYDFPGERRRRRLRALAVAGAVVFAAVVWKLTSTGGESTEDPAGPPAYEQIGAWRGYEGEGLGYTSLFALPDGCVLAFGADEARTLDPREGLECANPVEDENLGIQGTDGTYSLTPAATRFGDGFAVLLVTYYKDDRRSLTVLTGMPGAWQRHTLTAEGTTDAGAIAWDGTDLVVLGTDGEGPMVWRSTDGEKWREQRLPGGDLTGFELASDGRGTTLAAATTRDAPTSSRLWRSDGGAWTEVSALTGTFEDLAHDGTSFHLVGAARDTAGRGSVLVASSVDGREWTVDGGFWRGRSAHAVVPLADGALMVFTDGLGNTEGNVCEDVVHLRDGDAWTAEPLECGRIITDAVVLPDGRVVAVDERHVYVREAA